MALTNIKGKKVLLVLSPHYNLLDLDNMIQMLAIQTKNATTVLFFFPDNSVYVRNTLFSFQYKQNVWQA